jgi:hypothetical protein
MKTHRLNVQAIARQDSGLLTPIKADPGQVFVFTDVISGEPTITCHLTHDANYYAYIFGMVGREPFWSGKQLMIDDIYLGFASMCPDLAPKVQEAWRKAWPEGTFVQQWMKDPDVIKDALKKSVRAQAKVRVLGFGYGMGPKKLIKQAYDGGFLISEKDARASYKSYWTMFQDIKRYADSLAKVRASGKPLYNLFGYRLVPPEFKSYNYMIQSSLSGLISYYTMLMMKADYVKHVTCIHDEVGFSVPENKLEDFRKHFDQCVDDMNRELNWSVKVRFGWKVADNLYDIK